MKAALSIVCAIVFFLSPNGFAKDSPTSVSQLRSDIESAIKAKDTNAVISLICWGGVDGREKLAASAAIAYALTHSYTNVTGITLAPLPTNFQGSLFLHNPRNENGSGDTWEGDNGRRARFNIPVLGLLDLKSRAGDFAQLPYGETNGVYYIARIIYYLAPGKSLYVRVVNGWGSYTGSWTYVHNGKDVTVNISDKTNQFRQCWGDYIKSCTIQNTSTNQFIPYQNWFYFEISENGTNIFESGEITNHEPFTYTRK